MSFDSFLFSLLNDLFFFFDVLHFSLKAFPEAFGLVVGCFIRSLNN